MTFVSMSGAEVKRQEICARCHRKVSRRSQMFRASPGVWHAQFLLSPMQQCCMMSQPCTLLTHGIACFVSVSLSVDFFDALTFHHSSSVELQTAHYGFCFQSCLSALPT